MLAIMIGLRSVISHLHALVLLLAVVAGSLGSMQGAMAHDAPMAGAAHAHNEMTDGAGMVGDARDGAGVMGPHGDAGCVMAVCCFASSGGPRRERVGVEMSARFVALSADPALQPAPDRADKPPRRT